MALRTKIICHDSKCQNNRDSQCVADSIHMEKIPGRPGMVVCYDRYKNKGEAASFGRTLVR